MKQEELPPTVFIVDDDEAVRSSMKLLLKTLGIRTEAFASAQEFLAAFDATRGGCLVLDVRMPGMSGLRLQEELNARGALLPIIFVTGHGDIPMAVEAMQHGAMDFLQKPFRDQELLDRISKALDKDRAGRRLLGDRERIRAHVAQLTPREHEVMTLVTQGKPNKVIAADLNLSQRTVEIHRAHVMEKMGANSLAHLVRMVIHAGVTTGQ
jgi:FixJ family two-component response regulator